MYKLESFALRKDAMGRDNKIVCNVDVGGITIGLNSYGKAVYTHFMREVDD